MRNEKPEMNEQVGNTIAMKSSEQLSRENPETEPAPVVKEAQGKTFAEIAREKSIEYKPGAVETIPEQVSTQQLQADCLERLDGQYGD